MNTINIRVVKGGFILAHTDETAGNDGEEVFVSPRKLINKVKELVDTMSLVAPDKSEE